VAEGVASAECRNHGKRASPPQAGGLPRGLFVVRALGNDLPRVVFAHVRVNLAYVPLDLLDKPFVVVGREVDVFVRLVTQSSPRIASPFRRT